MPDEKRREVPKLAASILHGPLDVRHLVLPARLPIRAVLALLLAQRGLPEPALVVAKHGYAAIPEHAVDVLVAANVLVEPVDEDDDGFRLVGLVRARVELAVFGTAEPRLGV